MVTKEKALTDLLVSLFNEQDLIRFVRFTPDGHRLVARLPKSGSLLELATEVVELFRLEGLIDASFFSRLAEERPKRADEIREVEQLWPLKPRSRTPLTPQSGKTRPRVTFANHATASIDAYHEDFADIWKRDADDRSVFDLWLHVVDHAARVTRAVRRQRPPDVIDDVADTTVWLMSFIAHCKASQHHLDRQFQFDVAPSDLIWSKYPGVCPACFDVWVVRQLNLRDRESPQRKFQAMRGEIDEAIQTRVNAPSPPEVCLCLTRIAVETQERETILNLRGELDETRRSYARLLMRNGKKIHCLADLENMFLSIYGNSLHLQPLDAVASHLLEEVGEATQALKDCYTYDDAREPFSPELHATRKKFLLDELADVFSWLFAMSVKIRMMYRTHAEQYRTSINRGRMPSGTDAGTMFGFAEIIWSKYGMTSNGANWDQLKCPGCQSSPCECGRDIKVNWALRQLTLEGSVETPTQGQPNVESMPSRDLVFVAYSHRDSEWSDQFAQLLRARLGNNILSFWEDRKIGDRHLWRAEVESALRRAKVAVLLVTDNFIESDFIANKVLLPLLDAARVKTLAVPVGKSSAKQTELTQFPWARDPNRPLESLTVDDRHAALNAICEMIK